MGHSERDKAEQGGSGVKEEQRPLTGEQGEARKADRRRPMGALEHI